jgi:hypothetical protein
MARYGLGTYDELRTRRRAFSTQRFPQGQYREDNIYFNERNTDVLLTYAWKLDGALSLSVSAGGNQMTQERRYRHTAANQLAIPGIYSLNTTELSARDFYWSHFNGGNETVGTYDASFLKLREARLGDNFPRALAQKVWSERICFSVIGRNLLLFTENPHFDPEVFSYHGGTIVPGVEDMATPSSRSVGFNLNVTF